jgi:hypothetical protein
LGDRGLIAAERGDRRGSNPRPSGPQPGTGCCTPLLQVAKSLQTRLVFWKEDRATTGYILPVVSEWCQAIIAASGKLAPKKGGSAERRLENPPVNKIAMPSLEGSAIPRSSFLFVDTSNLPFQPTPINDTEQRICPVGGRLTDSIRHIADKASLIGDSRPFGVTSSGQTRIESITPPG